MQFDEQPPDLDDLLTMPHQTAGVDELPVIAGALAVAYAKMYVNDILRPLRPEIEARFPNFKLDPLQGGREPLDANRAWMAWTIRLLIATLGEDTVAAWLRDLPNWVARTPSGSSAT